MAVSGWEVVPPLGACISPPAGLASEDAPVVPADVSRETPAPAPVDPLDRVRRILRLDELDPLPPPERTRIMAIANQKGGVAKTTSAVNLAAALALMGQQVLVIDIDPQGNASTALAIPHDTGVAGTYEVLVGALPVASAIVPVPEFDGLWALPATVDLAGAEIELVSQVGRETRLRKVLTAFLEEHEEHHPRIDYVVIDCPPSLGLLTLNALVAAEEVVIPLQSEYYALEGLGHLLGSVELVREHVNPELRISAIMLTMFDGRTKLAPQVADEVRRHFPDLLLDTVIPRSVRVSEAPSYGQTVLQYDPASPGARAYVAAARELAGVAVAEIDLRDVDPSPTDAETVGELDTAPDTVA